MSMRLLPVFAALCGLCGDAAEAQGQTSLVIEVDLDLEGRVVIQVHGEAGASCAIESRTDLARGSWLTRTGVDLSQTVSTWVDPVSAEGTAQFYRAVKVSKPAIEPLGDLVWVPPGSFTMGSPANERGREGDEGPQTHVTLTRGFWLGRNEVTSDEYRAFLQAGGDPSGVNWQSMYRSIRQDELFSLTGQNFGKYGDQPMVEVSWEGAAAYCAWLTENERAAGRLPSGYAYRLPTEAQWEYACRAGTATRYSFGAALACQDLSSACEEMSPYLWWSGNRDGSGTHRVGSKKANPWGFHDMSGNVWEWCSDWYSGYPGGSVSDPSGPASGLHRVIRGGSYMAYAKDCRCAARSLCAPAEPFGHGNLGFRVALTPAP